MDLLPWMEQWNMLPPRGGTILCAVSGGRDSVCLLHYLCSLREKYGFNVAAAHYNHQMRPTAQRDQDFVTELCRTLDVPLYVGTGDVYAIAKERGLGVEETGRVLRYAYLNEVADTIGAQRIATAHHQDDQAETVLLNLLRGTGPEGLRGIPAVRGRLIRPLLDTPREEIEAYLTEYGLGHVEDETNASLAFTRNRLRKIVMPELEKIHPAMRRNIARAASIVGREDRFLNLLAAEYLPPEGTKLDCAALRRAPEVLRPRMVRLLLDRLAVGKKDMTATHVEAIVALALTDCGGMVSLPGGAAAICRKGQLQLAVLEPELPESMPLCEGENRWGPWCIRVQTKIEGEILQKKDAILLKCDMINQSLAIGPCPDRQRLTLPGSRGSRSVKRLLSERGIPPEVRRQTPAFQVDGHLAAVWRLGTDVEFMPEETGRWVEITLYKQK